MIAAPVPRLPRRQGRCDLTASQEADLSQARSLLESIALLETVASDREARVESLLTYLSDRGMTPGELARKLDISEDSVQLLLDRDEPLPPHERMGISEKSVEKLSPT
ncbi:MAG: hypothetical protein ACRDJU_09130 [Actinomycetota bacterium]